MEAETSRSTQLADFAEIKQELLNRPVTHEEQAIRLLIRREVYS